MLRITACHQEDTVTLRLEGQLQGPWVDELHECWQRERAARGGAAILIELVEVYPVDAAGRALLARMHRAGARLLASGALTKAICEEIVAGSETRGPRR